MNSPNGALKTFCVVNLQQDGNLATLDAVKTRMTIAYLEKFKANNFGGKQLSRSLNNFKKIV